MRSPWLKVSSFLAVAAVGGMVYVHHSMPKEPEQEKNSPIGRAEFERMRLSDPKTGKIPENIRMRELALASNLPKESGRRSSNALSFNHAGPYNFGGRTRAIAIDKSNPSVYLAGGVSGGLWRSTDEGTNWTRVTGSNTQPAVSSIAQDTRSGKTNTWYYGSGETVGNSASKSFSANYRGSGMYKSTDSGVTWNLISSTQALTHKSSMWDAIFNIAVDVSRNDSDVIYAAIERHIMRSNNGGTSWTPVITASSQSSFGDIVITSTGVLYATISNDGGPEGGFYRSTDGLSWNKITPSGLPGNHSRTVMAIAPSNEDIVYFYSETPNAGAGGNTLFKYEYTSGNGAGSGGNWTNLNSGIPTGSFWTSLSSQGGYCQTIAVKPDNENVVFIGGTNLFRSTNGFAGSSSVVKVGGYYSGHHADLQGIVFHPNNPNIMITASDGGLHKTNNNLQHQIQWTSLNNGYVTTQFYGIAIDHKTSGNETIIGGTQDNGTFWTNSNNSKANWKDIRGGDGAFVAIEDGGNVYYTCTQYANVERMKMSNTGAVLSRTNVMPQSRPGGRGTGYLFVHPFTLDPADNNIMYLPFRNEIWRNTDLAAADNFDLSPWKQIGQVPTGKTITAIAASKAPQGMLYVGTSSKSIYKVESANTASNPTVVDISNGISNGGYTSCIAIDPNDANKLIVVYSNYNTQSLWYSEDAGSTWTSIEGNLKGTKDAGLPDFLDYIGDGPSIRWAEIVPSQYGNTIYLGTSVGLYAAHHLKGDSTVWIQQGANTVGNVVVDMIDYRASDRYLAIGTHGNGIYTATVPANPNVGIADQSQVEATVNLKNFPNPAREITSISYNLPARMEIKLALYDQAGRKVRTLDKGFKEEGENTTQVSLDNLASGIYFYSLKGDRINITKKLIKE